MGHDRPGLLREISACLLDLGCNIEDVVSTVIRGNFALMLVCTAPEEASTESIHGRLHGVLGDSADSPHPSMHVDVWEVDETHARGRPNYSLGVIGPDRPGIIHAVAGFLDQHRIRIADLVSRYTNLDPGVAEFAFTVEIEIPAGVSVYDLKRELDAFCQKLHVDSNLYEIQ